MVENKKKLVIMTLSETLNVYTKKLVDFAVDLFAAFLILMLVVFVVGEFWALHFTRTNNPLMLWLPVGLLMLVLVVKTVD